MNASPANINPVNPAQTQPAAGKQQDSTTPDKPFSQVLSSEIAQNRRSSEARKESGSNTGSEAASQPADSAEASATPTDKTPEAEESTRDPLRTDAPATPDALLALALHPDQLKLSPASTGDAQSRLSAALGANMPSTLEGRKGRAPQALRAGQLANETAEAQKIDSTLPGKAKFQAATAAAIATSNAMTTAAAFSGQLAAARQTDAMNTGELLSDLMSNPAMRATPHAPLDAPTSLNGAATYRLAPSVGTTAWGQALGEKIVWMAAGAQQTASLTLNPPNLGPLQIVLNISNDQATASFFSAQPEVRQALEAAFPRLREMMNEAGIQLGQATVSADTPQQNAPDQRSQRAALPFSNLDEASADGLPLSQAPALQSGRGLIDTFA